MSDFAYQPAYGARIDHEPRVVAAEFGDGYQQRVGDGINTDPQTWELAFNRLLADIDAIEVFFALKAGVTAFSWTPEGGSEISVVCPRWQRIKSSHVVESINATFRQVFE